VNYPSPLAPANGDFDLVPDAAVLHELGAPSAQFHHVPRRPRKRVKGVMVGGIARCPPASHPWGVPRWYYPSLPTVFVSRTLGLNRSYGLAFEGGVMIIVKEIGLSLLIAVGAVAASDVVVFALEWFSVLFQ
jgi:hypothetical protein